jgi:uncharacterized protein
LEDKAEDQADAGETGGETGPVRRCVATWTVKPTGEMVRFVVDPAGAVVPDVAARLPGRGLWVMAERAAVERAARGGFAKAARAAVKVPPHLADQVETLLARRATDVLGLARRSGALLAGFDKVAEALTAGRVAVLVQAADASPAGRAKLSAKARALGVPEVDCLTLAELGLALGRENVVHAAVAPGGLAQRLLGETQRLHGFRSRKAAGDGGVSTE